MKQQYMAAQSLDTEFNRYWLLLSSGEKQTLLSVAKHYVELKDDLTPVTIEEYNKELQDAMTRIDNGHFVTHDQVKAQSQKWLHGQ